ncbi:MAG TPA: hypothetical protein VN192_02840 [Flavobacterium sp.]|nr:hypothetical protein [Flavobacterium sp.]
MTLLQIQNRNYQATVRRGKITPATTEQDFINKIKEETAELEDEVWWPFNDNPTYQEAELADIIIVCLNYAKHFNIDIKTALEQKTIYNENRND